MVDTITNGVNNMAKTKVKTSLKITAKKMGLNIYKKK